MNTPFDLHKYLIFCGGGSVAPLNPIATGGDISYAGGRKIHTFLTSGLDFQVFSVPVGIEIDYLIVGGGGGGKVGPDAGGGAGAGRVFPGTMTMAVGSYAVIVGAGGLANESDIGPGGTGGNSSFNAVVAPGGGGGGRSSQAGGNGGSGGGAGNGANLAGGGLAVGSVGLGNNGGNNPDFSSGAGGGGAMAVGQVSGFSGEGRGGNGGIGYLSSISGTPTYYGGGGGGGGEVAGGTGGLGGGGNGGTNTGLPQNGTANTGGGGGSQYSGDFISGGNGGSGIVIISYPWAGPEEDFGPTLNVLNADIAGMTPRDSAEYADLGNGSYMLLGGWNNGVWAGPTNTTDECWITSDFISFTAGPTMPFVGSHLCAHLKNDGYLYVFGSTGIGYTWVSFRYHVATSTWSTISSDITDLASYHSMAYSWVQPDTGEFFVAVALGTEAPDYQNIELWKTSDLTSATYVRDFPEWLTRANVCHAHEGGIDPTIIIGGGGYGVGGTHNLSDKVYSISDDGLTLTEVGTIPLAAMGLWNCIEKINGFYILIVGWRSDLDHANVEGTVYYSSDLSTWTLTSIGELLTRHAYAYIKINNKMYVACGELSNDSYVITNVT